MNKKIVELWEKNKENLRRSFDENYIPYGYEGVMNSIQKIILKEEFDLVDIEREGDYEGTYTFVISDKSDRKYKSDVFYGTCAACDMLTQVHKNEDVKGAMKLALHIIQGFVSIGRKESCLYNQDEEIEEFRETKEFEDKEKLTVTIGELVAD